MSGRLQILGAVAGDEVCVGGVSQSGLSEKAQDKGKTKSRILGAGGIPRVCTFWK